MVDSLLKLTPQEVTLIAALRELETSANTFKLTVHGYRRGAVRQMDLESSYRVSVA